VRRELLGPSTITGKRGGSEGRCSLIRKRGKRSECYLMWAGGEKMVENPFFYRRWHARGKEKERAPNFVNAGRRRREEERERADSLGVLPGGKGRHLTSRKGERRGSPFFNIRPAEEGEERHWSNLRLLWKTCGGERSRLAWMCRRKLCFHKGGKREEGCQFPQLGTTKDSLSVGGRKTRGGGESFRLSALKRKEVWAACLRGGKREKGQDLTQIPLPRRPIRL